MPRVFVLGSANVDLTMGVDRLPACGETVGGGNFLQAMGGKGANQAVAARRAGAEVRFITSVGNDTYGHAVLEAMRAEAIDLTGTLQDSGAATGVAVILYDRSGNNTIAVAPGANFKLAPAHLEPVFADLPGCALLVLQNELAPATLQAALEAARLHGTAVLLNFAPAHSFTLDALAQAASGNVSLVVNETEAGVLLGNTVQSVGDAMVAATALQGRGFRVAVVTLGAQGCVVASLAAESFHQPAMPSLAVDATAAGDTFCGALAAALVENLPLRYAVRFATAAASLATRTAGAQPSIPRREAVEAALRHWTD